MKDKSLGEKIRQYRTNKNISQFDLEVMIDASPGSLSKIENGVTNPTKETLQSIAKSLKLKDFELADLFAINLDTTQKLLELINSFSTAEQSEQAIINFVDKLHDEFSFHTGVFLKRGMIWWENIMEVIFSLKKLSTHCNSVTLKS